jgi:hypothetical protein
MDEKRRVATTIAVERRTESSFTKSPYDELFSLQIERR